MKRDRNLLAAVGAALVLFVAVNVLASGTLRGARVDLTAEQRFTLSPATERLLGSLEEDLVLQLYAAKQALRGDPWMSDHAGRVEELLEEYVARSGGRIRLDVLDPEPYSEVEDEAVSRGLRGFADPRGGGNLYLGLVAKNSTDGVETIPFLHPEDAPYLEYEISRMVQRLEGTERPTVAVVSALPLEGDTPNPFARTARPSGPWVVLQQLQTAFEVEVLDLAGLEAIPEHVDTLVVAHPRGITPRGLYAIDQFVLRGGRLLAFVDPLCDADTGAVAPDDPFGGAMAEKGSDLGPLLEAWGARLVPGQVAGDPEQALTVPYAGPSGRQERGRFPPFLRLGPEAFVEGELAARQLTGLQLGYAGILERVADATTEFHPVLTTTDRGAPIPVDKLRFPEPAKVLAEFPETGAKLVLAARLSGTARTAYPDGAPEDAATDEPSDEEPAEPEPAHLTESQGPVQVFVVADADLLADRFWVERVDLMGTQLLQRFADNGDFVLNAVDLLSGSGDLIELRGRGRTERPFDVVVGLQRASEERFRAEEQRLIEEERKMGQRIEELLRTSGDDANQGYVILPPELQEEVASLREQREQTRVRLREVRLSLNREVEQLGSRLRWMHVGALPGAVALGALLIAGLRSRARASAARHLASNARTPKS